MHSSLIVLIDAARQSSKISKEINCSLVPEVL